MNKTKKYVKSWDEVPVIIDFPYASILIGKSVEWLKKQSQKGLFPAFKIGKEWRVEKSALKEYLKIANEHNIAS